MDIQSGSKKLLEMLLLKSERFIEGDQCKSLTESEKGCVLMETASNFLLSTILMCVSEEGYEEVLTHFFKMAKLQLAVGSEEKEVKNELH
jgi:hypothetical protein